MNAEQLLAHYERVSEAPNAIERIKKLVLDLAVRGKLVPQDSNEEPSPQLVARLAAERARLVKARVIRASSVVQPIRDEELPIQIPPNWSWLRLCQVGRISGGMTPSMNRSDYWGGEVIWLSPKDIKSDKVSNSELKITAKGRSETRLEAYRPGCLFIVARSGILKRTLPVAINTVPAAANQDMKVLEPFIEGQERYLQIMFRGLMHFILSSLVKTGTTVQSLKYDEFEAQPFPIPPLAEQHRIVAKVDELMALCDRLEAARAQREAARDRLTASTLARLDTPEPPASPNGDAPKDSSFQSDARFALDAFPALTNRPDQIRQLRQTILELAMRGALTRISCDPTKVKIVDQSPTKREVPFPVPGDWQWLDFGDVVSLENGDRGKNYPNRDEYVPTGIPWINTGHIDPDGSLSLSRMHYITRDKFESLRGGKIRPGDLVYCLRGATFGKTAFVDPFEEGAVASSLMIIRPGSSIDRRYAYFYLTSPIGRLQLLRFDNGTAQPNLSSGNVRKFRIPLPPMAEQKRIIGAIDELMSLCDQLEASLSRRDSTRSRLLDALLHEALSPQGRPLQEAA